MTLPEQPGNKNEGPEPLPGAASVGTAWAPPGPPLGAASPLLSGVVPGPPPGVAPGLPGIPYQPPGVAYLPPGVVPDQPAEASSPRTGLGRRASAALVDIAILAVVFLILGLATGGTPAHTLPRGVVDARATFWVGAWGIRFGEATVGGWWLALYLALLLSYYFALEATTGRTVGKLLLGLRVTSRDGTRPSAAAIAARTLLRLVDWLPALYLVGFITTLATGSRRQRLGDLAARTKVAVAEGQPSGAGTRCSPGSWPAWSSSACPCG